MARDVDAPLPDDMERMLAIGAEIENAMGRDARPVAACHNDLLSENFILDRSTARCGSSTGSTGACADPYFDLGDFCVEHPFSEAEERLVIERYCGEPNERAHHRMLLHKLVADLWWSIWAMIQVRLSKIDFDFYEYGMGRVARFRRNAENPDYATWIATI